MAMVERTQNDRMIERRMKGRPRRPPCISYDDYEMRSGGAGRLGISDSGFLGALRLL